MDPLADSPTLAALRTARGVLQEATLDALALRRRVDVLADATDWRSRATEAYRAGVAALVAELARLVDAIGLSDGDLAAAQSHEVARLLARWRP